MLDYENSKNSFTDRKAHIQSISTLCKEIIIPHSDIRLMAKNIVGKSNAKEKDALHLAYAVYNGCEYFITCDDKFIKTIKRNKNKLEEILGNIRLFNPIDFLRREMEIDVIE